jgi:cation-transporting ATPase E
VEAPSAPLLGLTGAQVQERVLDGRTNAPTTRTLAEIVQANILTFFNALLLVLLVAILGTGRWQNGLFGLVIVANAVIGIVQEVRAKRTLDRLALLHAPTARVVRDGQDREIAVDAEVPDDLVQLRSGDQVRAGAIVVAGKGSSQALAVGDATFAAALATEARHYTVPTSELVQGTNRILRGIAALLVVIAPVLIWSQFRSTDNHGWQDAVTGTVAALVGMVPEGLVLLTSLVVVAAVGLVRRSTLVQELPSVEVLARVDLVCLNKTGTLTCGDIRFDRLELFRESEDGEAEAALGLFAHGDATNATAAAMAEAFPGKASVQVGGVPFSSARKWSAIETRDQGSWICGAPEMVLHHQASPEQADARARADRAAAEGSRVLLLAHTDRTIDGEVALPADARPIALVIRAERVREDAAETLCHFTEQRVALKIISGDNPRTVGAVAAALGVPGVEGAVDAVDARSLPDDEESLADAPEAHSAFGRVTPHQTRAIVLALQSRGHVVAMTGDGVNDALALKDADIGVAMGSGTAATRAVAQIVLLDDRFSHLPDVVAEGRRVMANIERAGSLFLVKSSSAMVLAVIVAFTGTAYPLAPIQLTLIPADTIGVPAFAFALGVNSRGYVPGFLHRVLRVAVPVGMVTGASAYLGFEATRVLDASAAEARTIATLIVLIASLWTLLVLARPLNGWKLALVASMAGIAALVLAVTALGPDVFILEISPVRLLIAGVIGAGGAVVVEVTHRAIQLVVRVTARPDVVLAPLANRR